MGAIMKGAKKRKTLTISFPKSKPKPPPRKGEVIIKKKSKPSTTKLSDTWQDRRIDAINRKIGAGKGMSRGAIVDVSQRLRNILMKLRIFINLKLQLKKFIKVFKRNGIH